MNGSMIAVGTLIAFLSCAPLVRADETLFRDSDSASLLGQEADWAARIKYKEREPYADVDQQVGVDPATRNVTLNVDADFRVPRVQTDITVDTEYTDPLGIEEESPQTGTAGIE
jgi:hypothetical protein